MLDQLNLEQSITREEYRARLPALQNELYALEESLIGSHTPVLLVIEGWAGTAKVKTIGTLLRRLDPRGIRVHPVRPPRTYEMQYPWLQRFWLKIPSYGQIAIFDRSWYREVVAARTRKQMKARIWRERCEDIVSFERQLADDGTIILKFWLHITKQEQSRRFQRLSADPLTAWQVTEEDLWQQKHYGRVCDAVEDMLQRTDTPQAPWTLIPATDNRLARLLVLETIIKALRVPLGATPLRSSERLEHGFDNSSASRRRSREQVRAPLTADGTDPIETPELPTSQWQSKLAQVDLSRRLDSEQYEQELAELQAKIYTLGYQVYLRKRPVVAVFEGWDAAGKGGAIQRLTQNLDPRSYVVHPIAAPAGDDRAHHYLYRFWRRLPARGQIAIFDRSWYGRVLVERVEGFARPDEWQRAYAEINEFERQLIAFGTIVCKFWLHISPEEQLRRFEERREVPYKAWKLTDEDWRNREKRSVYEPAVDEMLLRTSTPVAPWTIVEADDKRHARIKTLQTFVRRIENEIGNVTL